MNFSIKSTLRQIGNIGIEHCKDPHDLKSIRFLNYMSVFGVFIVLAYSLLSLFQFHFKYVTLVYFEISFVFILIALPIINKFGLFDIESTDAGV